jgi:hypothetical protein
VGDGCVRGVSRWIGSILVEALSCIRLAYYWRLGRKCSYSGVCTAVSLKATSLAYYELRHAMFGKWIFLLHAGLFRVARGDSTN